MVYSKKLKTLVIDSGAFLKNIPIWEYGEEFYTVEEVFNEIKDRQAKEFIRSLPVQVNLKEPKASSIKLVNDFTKKTGEYNSLSLADVKVLALTYELEVEAKGGSDHLRSEPVQRKVEERVSSKPPYTNSSQLEGFYSPSSSKAQNKDKFEIEAGASKPIDSAKVSQFCSARRDSQNSKSEDDNQISSIDIYFMNSYFALNDYIGGDKIEAQDLNVYFKLLSQFSYLKLVNKIGREMESDDDLSFFERFCTNFKEVYTNIVKRPKMCAHPEKCSDPSECSLLPEKCFHPYECYTFDKCIHARQCAHRRDISEIYRKDEVPYDDIFTKSNNYCDFLRPIPRDWKCLKAATKFYTRYSDKIFFMKWFFNLLRFTKYDGFSRSIYFRQDEGILKAALMKLRLFGENQEAHSESSIISDEFSRLSVNTENEENISTQSDSNISFENQISKNEDDNELKHVIDEYEGNDDDDDDDNEGWITPSNIKTIKEDNSVCEEDYEDVIVACISSDFAIQNTLLHIGLHTIGVDGKLIKSLRMYILRCFVCRTMCSDREKLFCYKCGYKTLKKVPYTLNPDGTKHIWESSRPINKRGMIYSLPAPKGGKYAVNPILSADQRVPHMRVSKRSLQRNDPLHEDYLAKTDNSPFCTRDIYTRSAQLGYKFGMSKHRGIFYWEKKNPNDPGKNLKKRNKR